MRTKKQGVFTFVYRHVLGKHLLHSGFTKDDSGKPILKHRLYAYEINRAYRKIYLNPRKIKKTL